mmetsp:Transcript_13916/g.29133  ORF Transcript_13916/g.29133 Transcript_13916/m.29133 type:complete len:687 (+) Transcript_13916:124-2184(+)
MNTGTKKEDTSDGGVNKIGFSLATNKKVKPRVAAAFGDEEDQTAHSDGNGDNIHINPDIPRTPLVIPCQKDSRQSLREQARIKREKQEEGQQHQNPDDVRSEDGARSSAALQTQKEASGEQIAVKQEESNGGDNISNNNNNDNDNDGVAGENSHSNSTTVTDEDRAAIEALKQEAAQGNRTENNNSNNNNNNNNKRVIASSGDTFQRQRERELGGKSEDQKKFEDDIEELPPDISVKSQVYKTVPIVEFGAAMLRGMGWTGGNENNNRKNNKNADPTTMPRPSRLGLGATPKMMASGDAPDTHSRRRPRRQDQVQREERLKRQQEEMEKERHRQFALDKQRVLQLGSIVCVSTNTNTNTTDGGDDRRRGQKQRSRAMIKQLSGVPGLNMILVQYEGDTTPIKVKKGSIELVDRNDLNERPFQEAQKEHRRKTREGDREKQDYDERGRARTSTSGSNFDDRKRDKKSERNTRYRDYDDDNGRDRDRDRGRGRDRDRRDRDSARDRDRDRDRYRDRDRRYRDEDRDRDRDRNRPKRKRDDEQRRGDDNKRHQSSRPSESNNNSLADDSASWLIPNIRVRVVSSKYGRSVYKEKGVVIDVTRKGVATLKMGSGQVISAPERHLETALPKAGGNAIILSGDQRFSKGQLLERDGKKNRGVVQVFEDMSIVTTSLDDMAEWCGPLDDDLEH